MLKKPLKINQKKTKEMNFLALAATLLANRLAGKVAIEMGKEQLEQDRIFNNPSSLKKF